MPSQSFFEVSAQVLPVLMLAVLVEQRALGQLRTQMPKHGNRWIRDLVRVKDAFLVLAVSVTVVLGETMALIAVAASPPERAAAYICLAYGFLGTFLLNGLIPPAIEETVADVRRPLKAVVNLLEAGLVLLPLSVGGWCAFVVF
jgi:hypothetical protein